ncbi:hypothetical protein TSUD_107080 [Trifolium subterraneum]|uniref:Senescence regulator S40 n=1 Tax=Trifolium subterraneum TaxID=3900 RepID=A0A2Z6MTY7_TRISU|nr:hypothetical protein TSUD_107080 [Trifolium subterraneum]
MDLHKPTRFKTRKFPTSEAERFLGVLPHAPPSHDNSTSTPLELTEDDVIFGFDYSHPSSSPLSIPTPNTKTTTNRHRHHHHQRKASPLCPHDSVGILASLPENKESSSSTSSFKAPISVSISNSVSSNSSSSSTSRPIHVVQRPSSDRTPSFSSPASSQFYHSAPVDVPMMSPEMAKLAREYEEEDARALVEEEEFKNTMPPHEYLSRQLEFSPMLSCSLFEGVGRTLKGRDLRQVRNAVLSQTGFFD